MRPSTPRIGVILFVSGFCSLVYQVVWLRELRLVFGASTASTAVVLAIFMGGLGLGGAILGRRAERSPNPLAFYAKLEFGIALTAALSPLLIGLTRTVYIALGGVGGMGIVAATLLRLVAATLILGAATTLMGGTLPAVAQAMEREQDRGRRLVAVLYGLNTAGAVVGAALTTFVLLEFLGVRQSLWLAAAINLLLAMVVRNLAREVDDAPTDETPKRVPGTLSDDAKRVPGTLSPPDDSPLGDLPFATPLVLGFAFLAGLLFFLMEIVWYRMLAPILGGSSYTFGLILVVALAGIALGGGLYGVGLRHRRPSLDALLWTLVLEALALILPYAWGDNLAVLAAALRELDMFGFQGLVVGWTAVTVLVVLPAAVVAGYQFPLLVALLGSGRDHVGSQVGRAYAWNTWGAIVGSLAGGFGLLPLLGATRLWSFSAILLVVLALNLALLIWMRDRRRRLALVLVGAVTLVLAFAPGPTAFWRHSPIGAGRLKADFDGPNAIRLEESRVRGAVLYEAEGIESSVALLEVNDLALYVNGKSDGSALGDAPTTVWLALVGALLHPRPENALVVGLGTGTTAGWMAEVETIERVDVLELEPAVGELAEHFAPITFDVMHHPKVEVLYGDGREHILTTDRLYDLIVSEPSNPYRAGVADLFSHDFYTAARRRLAPGGIFVQWLQGYEVDARLMRLVYSTLAGAFDHLETWQVNNTDLVLVGAAEPFRHDFDRIRRAAEREPFRTALERIWRVDGVDGFYSGFVAGDGLSRHLAEIAGFELSTDDRPRIEFGFARNVGKTDFFEVSQLQGLARELSYDHPVGHGAAPDWERVRELRQIREISSSLLEFPPVVISSDELARRTARQAYMRESFSGVERFWNAQGAPSPPHHRMDRLMLAEALAERAAPEAEAALATLADMPAEQALVDGRRRLRAGDPGGATASILRGFERIRRDDPWVYRPLVERTFDLIEEIAAIDRDLGTRIFDALAEPLPVWMLDSARKRLRVRLVSYLDFAGRCAEAFAAYEPYPLWTRAFLEPRADCYEAAGDPRAAAARRDLERLLVDTPAGHLDPSRPLDPSRRPDILPSEAPEGPDAG